MKTLLSTVAVAALLGFVGQASAADMGARPMYTKAPMVAPAYNWTGAYIGVNGGGGWGSVGGIDTSGGFVGGTLGYNWQQGQTVFGLETDIAWSGIDGSTNVIAPVTAGNDWFGTVRGRLGVAVDRSLWYVAGGLAYGNVNVSSPAFASVDTTNAGWTLGGGVEVALNGPWTAKVEYLHLDLGSVNVLGGSVDSTNDLVRAGLNYRF